MLQNHIECGFNNLYTIIMGQVDKQQRLRYKITQPLGPNIRAVDLELQSIHLTNLLDSRLPDNCQLPDDCFTITRQLPDNVTVKKDGLAQNWRQRITQTLRAYKTARSCVQAKNVQIDQALIFHIIFVSPFLYSTPLSLFKLDKQQTHLITGRSQITFAHWVSQLVSQMLTQ